ncbi:hypothetical protein [Streptomyces sp. NBC_00102]|uniref:hypothetical protein n=1 Tax=Streptomyces sp. NBC_00102 TaxID=2975652 RepID=UPI00224FA76C|nr:hypothetical protein [Streptomyces sp. NBC_00102]MCX5401892.1 hypothetical protein [Streptomyces sp. NBC_00102]
MAGTDDLIATDDDALYVLTALLLTPANFPTVLGDDYPAACEALALEPYEEGYGLVLGQDGAGARWTVVTEDVTLVAGTIAAWDCGIPQELSPDDRTVVCALPGWPLALAVAAPGVPAPHDPEPEPAGDEPGGALLLTPPSESEWGPEQRRMGADEVAAHWASWREQVDAADPGPGASATLEPGNPEEQEPESKGSAGVRRVLEEARDYLDSPPPPGRVRSSFASADARTLRVDGPGWSLVARTDDMAFVLLDEEPGEVMQVRQGPQLLELLSALDALATRPA